MPRRLSLVAPPLALALLLPSPVSATQDVAGADPTPAAEAWTLEDALRIARTNNPAFARARNDETVAEWNVRSAYASLLPSASFGSGISWQGSGDQTLGTLTAGQLGFGDQPDFWTSSFNLSLGYQIDGATILAPGQARAERSRTRAQIRSAQVDLEQQVTTSYLDVLRQVEEVALARQQLERARFNLRLAEAQRDVGQVTPLDVQQAGVQVGRAEVTLLQFEQALENARLRLLQQLGLELSRDFELVTEFELNEPRWDTRDLYARAAASNPTLGQQRSAWEVSDYDVRISQSRYLPSLSISTGIGGFAREASSTGALIRQAQAQVASRIAQCEQQNEIFSRLTDPLPLEDCSRFAFTDEDRRALVEENDVFPFDFTRSAPSVSLSLSLPIFQGLDRQRQLEAAEVARRDAGEQIREQELALEADVAVAVGNVRTAYQSALIEERNQELADAQLRLAREQYTVGLLAFVDLVEAETVKAEADRARVAAVFAYHDAITQLEAIVGTALRDETGGDR